MTCEETCELLSPYADGELDLVRALEIERHLQQCPACATALERDRSLGERLRDPALYHPTPPDLRGRVRAALGRAGGARGRFAGLPWRRLGAAAAAAVLAAFGVWGAATALTTPSRDERLAQEVVAAHVKSVMANRIHLLDVKSSDQHTVKPWFIGKVDFAPEVKDLSKEGFPLEGGRLDYVGGRDAAALVYKRNEHVINVFIEPSAGKDHAPQSLESRGYHLIRWTDNGRTFWVVSDLNAEELRQFAELLRR